MHNKIWEGFLYGLPTVGAPGARKYCSRQQDQMDSALELWRGFYRIEVEAYNQLLSILVTFGPTEEIAHFTDGSQANLLLTGSNLVDESAFNASILNPNVFNSGLPESGVPNGGLANEDLSHWHSDTSGA